MRILIATDGSPNTEMALRLSAQIVRRAGTAPTVLTVIDHVTNHPSSLTDAILARARELLGPAVPKVLIKVPMGHPVEEIICKARQGNYDLVIVGERQRRGRLARLMIDSTAVQVARRAPCPVIVVKGKAGPIHRILLCDSGAKGPTLELVTGPSALSRFTAQLIGLLVGEAEISVLHVMSQMSAGPGVRGKQLRAGAEELIQEHTPEGRLLKQNIQVLERSGIHPHPKVRHGLVVDEILAEARDGNYDLVVIGAYRGQGWRHIVLDDLAHKILVRSERSVLVVR